MAEKAMLRRTRLILSALGIIFAAGFMYFFGQIEVEKILDTENPTYFGNLLTLLAFAAGFVASTIILAGTFLNAADDGRTITFMKYNWLSKLLGKWRFSLCSAFWFFTLLLWLSMVLVGLLISLGIALHSVIQENGFDAVVKIFAIIGALSVFGSILALFGWLGGKFKPINIFNIAVSLLSLIVLLIFGYVIWPIQNIMEKQGLAMKEELPIYGKSAGIIVLCIVAALGIIFLALRFIPRLRNTFLGRWLRAILNNACPDFAISPAVLPPAKPRVCAHCGQTISPVAEIKAE